MKQIDYKLKRCSKKKIVVNNVDRSSLRAL